MKKRPTPKSLIEALRRTIHNGRVSIQLIAARLGKSENALYRACLESDNISSSGATFPLQSLLALMQVTNEYCILEYLAQNSGFLLLKIPAFKSATSNGLDMMNDYHQATSQAISTLGLFLKNPTDVNLYNQLISEIRTVMERSVEAQHFAQKAHAGQLELF